MRTGKVIALLATAAAAAAMIVAVIQFRAANTATAELREAQREIAVLSERMTDWENKIRAAERRATDAERDLNELLKAVRSVGAQHASLVAANRPQDAATPLVLTTRTVSPPDSQYSEEEKQRLAQERKYQQELAKKRAAEARARAEFDTAQVGRDPGTAFQKSIERVEHLFANGEFQAAIRMLNAAMTAKPADLPVPDRVRELQAILQAQSSPVEVTLLSDNATFVSISGTRQPQQLVQATAKLMPGDYQVIGRRPGFRDVEMALRVRNDASPPVVSVICTQPVVVRP